MKTTDNKPKLNIVSVMILIGLTGIIFTVFQVFYMPHDFDNLGGKHAWVSGSTIKYVNMWLEEGAGKLHFTNMEKFPSIELQSFEEREPYVTYPPGVTVMVWLGAKLCGKSHIDIYFLKHFQLIMYGIESILMALLIYVFCERNVKAGEKSKLILSVAIATLWMTLPVNNWFLTNIYWTDLAVYLWIIAYLLLESVSDWDALSGKAKKVAEALKSIVIVAGVLTEYYFCIVVFFGFLFNIVYTVKNADGKKLRCVIKSSLKYIIPVVVALTIYIWQMSYTNNWAGQLADTFLHRTGVAHTEDVTGEFKEGFLNAITCSSILRAVLLIVVEGIAGICIIIAACRKKLINIFTDKSAIAVAMLIVTPVVQLLMFWNHSSIHQYSMVKVGLQIIGVLLGITGLISNAQKRTKLQKIAAVFVGVFSFVCILLATGYPGRIKEFYEEKNKVLDYSIAEAIAQNTGFDDVCFSFTYVISNNPPMDICVSEKMVYEIASIDDVYTMFDELSEKANLILVVDKNNIGSNDYIDREKTDDIIRQEQECISLGKVIYEDDRCVLINLPHSEL